MSRKTKVILALAVVAALILAGLVIYWELSHGNRRLARHTPNRHA